MDLVDKAIRDMQLVIPGYFKYFVFEMKKDIRSFFSTIKGQ